jgi:hypothetical protein
MISASSDFLRLIDRGQKSASGSAPRLPEAVAAAPTALGMSPEHQLSGPDPPGAAREPHGAPNGRHRAYMCQAHSGAFFDGLQKSTKIAHRAAGEAAAGGGDGQVDGLGAGGGGGAVGGGVGDVGGTCGAHPGCCQGAIRVARERLRACWASKTGLGGQRRIGKLAKDVVLTLGCRPQTKTPLPEPWLRHNHGSGGLQDCWPYRHRPATYERGGWRPLSCGMGCEAHARDRGLQGGVEGVLSTVSDDSSTKNSAPARPMSHRLAAGNFGSPQHVMAWMPCIRGRGDRQTKAMKWAGSVKQGGGRDRRARAGLGTALIDEGRADVDAYHLAPVEICHAEVLGEGVVSGRRRSLTAQAAPSAVHASTAAAALRRLDPHDVSSFSSLF